MFDHCVTTEIFNQKKFGLFETQNNSFKFPSI